jgi:hypothetical protein
VGWIYSAEDPLPACDRKIPGATAVYLWPVAKHPKIEPITPVQLNQLLPMIAEYQRFYEVEEIDEERNREFFARFVAPSEDGMLLGACRDEELVGYAPDNKTAQRLYDSTGADRTTWIEYELEL